MQSAVLVKFTDRARNSGVLGAARLELVWPRININLLDLLVSLLDC